MRQVDKSALDASVALGGAGDEPYEALIPGISVRVCVCVCARARMYMLFIRVYTTFPTTYACVCVFSLAVYACAHAVYVW